MRRRASIWLSHLDGTDEEGRPEATAALPLRQNVQERLPVGAAADCHRAG